MELVTKVMALLGAAFMAVGLVMGVVGVIMAVKTPVAGPEGVDQPAGAGASASEIFKRFLAFLQSIFTRIDKLYKEAIDEAVPHKKVERYGALFVQIGMYLLIIALVAWVVSLINGGGSGADAPSTPGTTPPSAGTS